MWEVAIRTLQKSAPGSDFNCRATFVTLKIHTDECKAAFYDGFFFIAHHSAHQQSLSQ